MQVIILRGLPGAGKDWWIDQYIRKHPLAGDPELLFPVCSADHYHYKVGEGKYLYKPENQGRAHLACLEKFLDRLQNRDKFHTLFVSNTNTTAAEIAPYWQLASLHDVPARIVHIHVPFAVACKRNVHNVPPATIWRMRRNLLTEALPAHWVEEHELGETP